MKALLSLVLIPALLAVPQASAAGAESDLITRAASGKQVRQLEIVLKGEGEDSLRVAGRVKGADGRGIFVYYQIRNCGKGKWKNLERETTTRRGVYNFTETYKPANKRKFKVKFYDVKFPDSTQFGLFIPATEKYAAVRLEGDKCYGG